MNNRLHFEDWFDIFASKGAESDKVFWISTLDYKELLYLSSGFESVWQYDRKVLFDDLRRFGDFLVDECKTDFLTECIERHIPNTPGNGRTFKIRTARGEEKIIHDRYMTLYDDAMNPIAAAGLSVDITNHLEIVDAPPLAKLIGQQHQKTEAVYREILKEKLGLIVKENKPVHLQLSRHETQCVYHLLRGKTAQQTADSLHLSRRAIEYCIDTLKEKFQCANKAELAKKLVSQGYYNQNSKEVDSCAS